MLSVCRSVAKNQYRATRINCRFRLRKNSIQRSLQCTRFASRFKHNINLLRTEPCHIQRFQLCKCLVRQHRLFNRNPTAMLCRLRQNILEASNVGSQIHHNPLPNRVDRRIGYLRKQLLEVVRQLLRSIREHRQRIIRTHRSQRFLTPRRHRLQNLNDILIRIPKRLLLLEQCISLRGLNFRRHSR